MERIYERNKFVSSNFTFIYRIFIFSVLLSGLSIFGYKSYYGININVKSDIFLILIAAGLVSGFCFIIIVESLWRKAIRKCLEDTINFHSKDCLIKSSLGLAVDVKLKQVAIATKKDSRFIEVKNVDAKDICSEIVIETKQEKKVEKVKTSVGGRIAGGLLGGAIGATIGGIASDKYKETKYTVIENVILRIIIKSDTSKIYDFSVNFVPHITKHKLDDNTEYKELNRIHNLLKSTMLSSFSPSCTIQDDSIKKDSELQKFTTLETNTKTQSKIVAGDDRMITIICSNPSCKHECAVPLMEFQAHRAVCLFCGIPLEP